ncbi:MAG: ectoine/hydroxyectoine ABC transporter ATP-binding protein EhuA [Mesorhizobium sp.]
MGAESRQPILRLRGVSKSYGSVQILREIDLDVGAGQRIALIGPSGSGKTTLLRLVMTLETPEAGTIEVEGELLGLRQAGDRLVKDRGAHLRSVRGKIGMVFQHFNLFPHMTALQNIMDGPVHVRGLPKEQARARALDLLSKVGLRQKADSYPRQLSGGQQQRVAIARALAMEPKILLFDEITSALDPELVGEVLTIVRNLANETGTTMLIVTHEMGFAREVADRVLFMEGGRIVEDGDPEQVFANPRSERTRAFLGAVLHR